MTTTELVERRQIFNEKLAKCTHYRKKCEFWQYAMIIELIISVFLIFLLNWPILSVILFLLVYIPANIRLAQYSKAVDDL